MIKLIDSKSKYRNEIVALWQQCFGDNEDYIRFFLDNCPAYDCLGYLIEDKLVSMLFLLDGKINSDRCMYLYAACTSPNYRKQGIMERLIDFAKSLCIENDISSIFLVPANEKLYSYYSKFGFLPSFKKQVICRKGSNPDNLTLLNCTDVNDICRIKKQLLLNTKGFLFSDKVLQYTVKEHLYNGGLVSLYQSERQTALLFYYSENNDVVVKEMLTDFEVTAEFIDKLFTNNDIENIYIYTPIVYNNKNISEEYTKCGMCLPLNQKTSEFLTQNRNLYAGMYLD